GSPAPGALLPASRRMLVLPMGSSLLARIRSGGGDFDRGGRPGRRLLRARGRGGRGQRGGRGRGGGGPRPPGERVGRGGGWGGGRAGGAAGSEQLDPDEHEKPGHPAQATDDDVPGRALHRPPTFLAAG